MFTKAFSFSLFAQDIIYVKSRSDSKVWIETVLKQVFSSLFEKKNVLYLKAGKEVSALS